MRKEDSERTDYGQYAVFMTNAPAGAVTEYSYRWQIESGYKSVKRFMAATTRRISGCGSSTSRSPVCSPRSGERSICWYKSN
jgi:hypothetical protein